HERRVGRVQPGGRGAEGVQRVAAEVRFETQADVRLEQVAAADVADRLADSRGMLLRRGDQAEGTAGIRAGPGFAGRVRPARQFPEPALQRVFTAGGHQRLDRPPAGGPVAPEHVIVVAEPAGRQAARLTRRWRHRQYAAGAADPESADPAAAETSSPGPFGHITGVRRVKLLARLYRAGGHDVAASGPGAQQRYRVRVG